MTPMSSGWCLGGWGHDTEKLKALMQLADTAAEAQQLRDEMKVKALMQLADTAAEVQQLRDEVAALQQEVRKRDEINARE
ncbi:unnamed protein product [Closterium sp. Naga37s-1]|nr:unnamed protein product [Closterium sp. Naga37s-1]